MIMPRAAGQLLLPANPWFIGFTLVVAMMIDMVPAGRLAAMPDVLAVVLVVLMRTDVTWWRGVWPTASAAVGSPLLFLGPALMAALHMIWRDWAMPDGPRAVAPPAGPSRLGGGEPPSLERDPTASRP